LTRATAHRHAGQYAGTPHDSVELAHDERHLRRRLLTLRGGGEVLVDFPAAVVLEHGDVLVLEDGRLIEVHAAREKLMAIRGRDATHLHALCWHLGNRHLPAQIGADRILVQRDHVIRAMLEGLGAQVEDVTEPFTPVRGAYHGHGHAHG